MRYVTVCLLIAFVLAFAGVSQAGTQEWKFAGADSDKDWEPITGDWSIQDGEYSQDERGTPAMRSLVGDENWGDYTVEADIQVTGNSYAGLIFRAQSEFEYHVFYMNVNSNVVEWWEHTLPNADTRSNHFNHAPVEITIILEEWYTFKVIAVGNDFEFYINDILQDAGSDDTYPEGRIGMWAWDTTARFDNITVTGDDISGGAAVSSLDKLAKTWGEIKK